VRSNLALCTKFVNFLSVIVQNVIKCSSFSFLKGSKGVSVFDRIRPEVGPSPFGREVQIIGKKIQPHYSLHLASLDFVKTDLCHHHDDIS
jgi:hypothetical protein